MSKSKTEMAHTRSTNSGISVHCFFDKLVSPDRLMDHPQNPNTHPESQIKALAEYFKFTGWIHPIIVSKRSGYIVAGHGRKSAAILIDSDCPVVYQDFEDETEEVAFLLADNHFPELSENDMMLTLENLDNLKLDDFDLSIIGFDDGLKSGSDDEVVTTSVGKSVSDTFVTAIIPIDVFPDAKPIIDELRKIPGVKIDVEAH